MTARLPSSVRTERLLLRQWSEDDVPALVGAVTESLDHLRPWMPWVADEPLSDESRLELIREWKEQWKQGGDTVLGIFREGEVVGGTGLHRRIGPNSIEIGYWIHVAHTGQGYATEAARALTDAAFEISGVEAVEIHHDRANLASRRVPEKLGFAIKREKQRDPRAPGETDVEIQWIMTREAWEKAPTG